VLDLPESLTYGTFPLFEYELIIPAFHEGAYFTKWFDEQNLDLNKSDTEK
jgi:hypothetical protein